MTTCKYCLRPLPSEWSLDHHIDCHAACQDFWQNCAMAMLQSLRCPNSAAEIATVCDSLTEEWRKRWL